MGWREELGLYNKHLRRRRRLKNIIFNALVAWVMILMTISVGNSSYRLYLQHVKYSELRDITEEALEQCQPEGWET